MTPIKYWLGALFVLVVPPSFVVASGVFVYKNPNLFNPMMWEQSARWVLCLYVGATISISIAIWFYPGAFKL